MTRLRFHFRHPLAACLAASAMLAASPAAAQDRALPDAPALADYFPEGHEFDHDPEAPTPESVLGVEIGLWHLHHHELVAYLAVLAEWSDRITMEEYARSHGRRPLVVLHITDPENHSRLEAMRETHLAGLSLGEGEPLPPEESPLVLWMGYGVHGDEPSASNVAPLLAYHLAAARSPEVRDFLKSSVVLLEPCLNPDGMERFAAWTNANRGRHPSSHRSDREHVQDWPGGRTNYYWFDLNRDWLPAVHPESQGRLELYHRWLPHVVTDYHEMGNVNRSYFFQPGIAEMVHPLTPDSNQELTARIAAYHAQALDAIKQPYYTGESFDDYYIGKGSTYPDLCGSIGILYEQASSRGYHQATEYGRLTFPKTIRNQLATSLSTLEAASAMRGDLVEHQRGFHRAATDGDDAEAAEGPAAHLVSSPRDPQLLAAYAELLDRHRIRYQRLASDLEIEGETFSGGATLVIPSQQPRHHLLNAMMEKRTEFDYPLFYDVSAWHLPSAYGLRHTTLDELPETAPDAAEGQAPLAPAGALLGPDDPVSYLLPWEPMRAPAALFRLGREEVRVWAAQRPIFVEGEDGEPVRYAHGTLVVPVGAQEDLEPEALRELMAELAETHGLEIRGCASALGTGGGIDLGSPSLAPVRHPEILLAVGSGVSALAAGDLWHHFDQVWGTPVTQVNRTSLNASLLRDFNTLILAETSFSSLSTTAQTAIEGWVSSGGLLVATGSAVSSLASQSWIDATTIKVEFDEEEFDAFFVRVEEQGEATNPDPDPMEEEEQEEEEQQETDEPDAEPRNGKAKENQRSGKVRPPILERPDERPYDTNAVRRAARQVRGVVAEAWYDSTHPIAYGYEGHGPAIALMKNNSVFLAAGEQPYRNALLYTDVPLVAGHVASKNLGALKGSIPVQVLPKGSGRVVLFADNPVFRGHWHGSSKLLANAIFFGPLVSSGGTGDESEALDELEEDEGLD